MSRLEIATLGPPEIRLEGASLAGLASNKVRALLVYLAVESGRAHRRESLAGLLWPDYPERSARTNLSNALSNLRTALGDRDAAHPLLDVSRDTIQLNLGGRCCVDAVAFEACLERGQWQEAARAYRGPFLEGFSLPDSPAFEQWALLRRERAQRQAVEALGELAAGCERRDELGEAIRAVRRQLELEPWHEEGHRALMRLLARDGQRGAALAQYQVCRRTLQRELEVAPGRATQALYEAIRSGDVAPVKGRAGRRAEAGGPPSPAAVAAPEPASADRTLPAAVSPAPLSPGGERRWVTALHVELDQAATLLDQVGAEEWMRITAGALDIVVEVVHRYGAEVVERRAEGAVALFGVPVAHEDDAERAVLAALGVQAQVGDGPGLRIGVDAGEALMTLSGEHRQVVGRALALARRASVAAEPGTVSLGENAHRLVRRLFEWEEEAEGVASGTHRPLRRRADVGKARGIPGLSSPLVGRDAELQALQGAIDRLAAGVGGIVTIVGEAGIGKSRLVAEIRKHNLAKVAHRTALRAGGDAQKPSQGDDASGNLAKGKHPSQGWDLQWVEGRCLSYGGSIAYSLWLDMLHSVLDVPHNAAATIVRDALRAQVQALCTDCFDEVYPSLCRLLSLPLEERYASLRDLQGESLRAEVFAAVQTLIERTASRRPLAMICEDLHWADPTSLALLERILALTDRAALLLICALRPEVEHGCWQVREAAARYYRHRQTDLWLDALTAGETQALVGHLLHVEDLPWALQSKILDHAEGNPFYAEEILRELIDNGAIVYDDATGRCQVARGIETIPIPDTLQGVLSARIDRLEPETRRVLRLASVIGRVFPYRILAEIAGDGSPLPAGEGTGVRALDVHLLALQRQQLIRERARLPEVEYIFQHELTREAAYSGLLKAERLACHRRAAEALERLYPDQLEEQAALLAQHWEGAEESERAIECRLEAGEPARVAYANEEAIAHFRRALSLLDGHELNEAHPEWRLDALRGLGIALFGTGRADEAEAPLREAIAIGVRIGLEAHALVRLYYWLGEVRYWQGHGSDMADIGKEGLSLLDADEESVERALMMHHLATGLLNQLWSVEQYGEWGLRLARFVSRLPYEEELRPVYNHIVFSHRRLKETGAMVRWIAELEERATAHRDLRGVAEAALLRSIVCLDAGDLRGATARLSQAADMWGRLGDTKHQVRELAGIGTLYLDLGELDRAEEVITCAAAVAGRVPDGLAPSPMHEGKIAFCRGEWQAAVDAFDKAVETARGLSLPMEEGYASLWLGMVALAQADRRRAVACLQKGIALETLPDSIHFSRLLSRRLGALEAAWQDRAAFRAFCHRYQEEHPEIRERSPARCWLEPAHAGDLSGLGDLTGLDSLNWTWHDPFGDCACAPDGGLTIRAANGRDMWHVNWSAPRLMRAVPDDLAMQTIVGPAMDDRPAMGGLLLWMDERSYLGLQWGTFGPGQVGLEGAIENVDVVIGRGLLPDGAQERAFLRLERRGDHVAAFCSADGEAWFRVGRARFPAGPAQVGLYAIGSIDRAIYPGAYPDGTAIRFESFQLWEGGDGWHPAWRST